MKNLFVALLALAALSTLEASALDRRGDTAVSYLKRCYYEPVTTFDPSGVPVTHYVQRCYWVPVTLNINDKEIVVPGGGVEEPWGVSLESVFKDAKSITLVSGPSWAKLDEKGVLQGTPMTSDAGENRWEISVETGSGTESVTVVTYIWGGE